MAKTLFLILNACVCIQLVLGQAKTAWSAANGGIGLGTTSAPDPTDHQIHLALVGINNAATELEAAQAAATIYSPTLDMSDNVKQALENKVRVLRTPPGWTHPIPPPLPFGFDVMTLIMSAYYGTATPASAAAPPAAAPVAAAAPQPGPRTAIRRGPAPGKRSNLGSQQNAWQQSQTGDFGYQNTGVGEPFNAGSGRWDSAAFGAVPEAGLQQGSWVQNNVQQQTGAADWTPQQGSWGQNNVQQQGAADWTPLASSNADWINPFEIYNRNSNPSTWK